MPATLYENRTKSALEQTLRQLLADKPLDQIRVREITELCSIRRQSFYYHFSDVYALFDWSLQQERSILLARQEQFLTWQQALTDLLEHIARNRPYYRALLHQQGRNGLRELLGPVLEPILSRTAAYYQQRCGTPPNTPPQEFWEPLLLTLLEGWIRDTSQQPQQLMSALDTLIRQSSLGAAWQNLPAHPR